MALPLLGLLVVCGPSAWAASLPLDPERPPDPEARSAPGAPASTAALARPATPRLFLPLGGSAYDPGSRFASGSGLPLKCSFQDSLTQRTVDVAGISRGLLTRMETEARRFRGDHVFDAATTREPFDSVAESLRMEEARTIFTRAFNRTLENQADVLARSSSGLGAALDWLEDFGARRRSSPASAGADARAAAGAPGAAARDTAAPESRSRAGFGLRIGVHPRLVLRTDFGGFRARVEIAPPGEPVRLSVERPLGGRGRLVLTSGLQGGDRDWAALAWTLRF